MSNSKRQINIIKALSDETRLRILKLLLGKKELCVCELEAVLDIPQSKASRHLSILKNVELVEDRRNGVWIFYSLPKPRNSFDRSVIKLVRDALNGSPVAKEDAKRLKKELSKKQVDKCA